MQILSLSLIALSSERVPGNDYTENGRKTFLWPRAKHFSVGWFADHTWKNNNKWYTYRLNFVRNFYTTYIIYETGEACDIYGRQERCFQGFGGEDWGKEASWKT